MLRLYLVVPPEGDGLKPMILACNPDVWPDMPLPPGTERFRLGLVENDMLPPGRVGDLQVSPIALFNLRAGAKREAQLRREPDR
jgi:hypothetical protein